MVCNFFSNMIEIICCLNKGLFFLPHKNNHESLSANRIFVLCLTMTQTRFILCCNLCFSCIKLGLFVLLSIAGFLSTLLLFVALFFTIWAKELFPTAFLMQIASNRSITLLRWSRTERRKTSICWQEWFRLTIHVGSELLCKGNHLMLFFRYTWLFVDFLLHRLV